MGRSGKLNHLAFAVVADLAFEGAEIVGRIKLGDANEPHGHAALWARRLKRCDRSVGFRMKLRHDCPHARQLTDAKFSDLGRVPVKQHSQIRVRKLAMFASGLSGIANYFGRFKLRHSTFAEPPPRMELSPARTKASVTECHRTPA
jgi:hypothetical protein